MARRSFNGGERAALYLASDGKCELCGVELDSGWHGDHIKPFSLNGETDVINGQALCPPCNLKKGNRMSKAPREWQQQAREKFFAVNQHDFLLSATPGAGKTTFALNLAVELKRSGTVEQIAVVVPTDSLRGQWADQAAAHGLSLMPVADGSDYNKKGYDGCVVTYQQLATGAGSDLLRKATARKTIAILDEIHHAGDNRAWGQGLRNAVGRATVRLGLTGTPWRQNKYSPIPFVTYDDGGEVVVDYAYEYGTAVADGVCRRIEFHAYDGEARWVDCGKIETASLGTELAEEDVSAALDAVLHPEHSWMPTLLLQATRALDELRTEVPDAGGLVIAHRIAHAFAYAKIIASITGIEPTVVVSEDPEAKAKIDRFRTDRSPWIVAVTMVSEGVDIPRLAVGVYATKISTPLFFRQATGRVVRVRPGEDFNARLYIPNVPAFKEHARAIEEELRHQLELERERDEKDRKDSDGDGQQSINMREPLSASESFLDGVILGGDDVTPEEVKRAAAWCLKNGVPDRFAANVAKGLRTEQAAGPLPEPEPVAELPRHRRERILRGEIKTLAGKVAYRVGIEVREVNAQLLRDGYASRSKASIEQLEQIRDHLARQLEVLCLPR